MALPVLATAQQVAGDADKFVSDLVSKNMFSGNVLIARDSEILFEKSYGYADLENKRLNTSDTEFRAGSLTKMFTATLILQYIDKEKISLWDTLDKFAPHIANAENITIRNLLSHSSGIKGSIPDGAKNLKEIVKGFKSEPSAFKPGSNFEYNNFNYMLLGYIAEKIGGKPYAELVSRNLFRKAGMENSGIDYDGRVSSKSALGYMVSPETGNLARMESANVNVASSAGALYTTAADLLKWSQAIENGKLLSGKTWQMAFTEVRPGYGLGWMVRRDGDRVKFGHTGSIEGFMADFQYFPESGVTVIFLSNVLPPKNTKISSALSAIAFNQPFEMDKPKEEIALSAEVLRKYVGTYELEGQKMVVSQKEGKLMVLAPMGDTAELGAVGPNKFFVKGPQIGVEFLEENGKITAMNLDMRGGQRFVKLQ